MFLSKSLWHISKTKSEIREEQVIEDKRVLVKTLYSLISLGTEKLIANGEVPLEVYEQMSVPYMDGSFDFPLKYGYSLVGEVASKDHPLFGKRVHALHPHQEVCLLEEKDLFVIPEEVDSKTATLASNLETALNAVWDGEVSIGDKVLVTGFGLIGSLIARLVQMIPGTELIISEINPVKNKWAKDLGFKTCNPIEVTDFDIAFHCSASSEGLQSCIDATGFESKIIELSWYGEKTIAVQFGASFHQQRKKLISSQVSNLPTDRRGRWDFKRRKELVFKLLKEEHFQAHITKTIALIETPAFFEKLRKGEQSELGVCIEY